MPLATVIGSSATTEVEIHLNNADQVQRNVDSIQFAAKQAHLVLAALDKFSTCAGCVLGTLAAAGMALGLVLAVQVQYRLYFYIIAGAGAIALLVLALQMRSSRKTMRKAKLLIEIAEATIDPGANAFDERFPNKANLADRLKGLKAASGLQAGAFSLFCAFSSLQTFVAFAIECRIC